MHKLLAYMDVAIPMLAFVFSFVYLPKRRMQPTHFDYILLLFFLYQVLLNGIAHYLQYRMLNNHWVYHTNSFCTQLIFTYLFYVLFHTQSKKTMVLGGLVAYAVFFIFNIGFIQPYTTFNSYSYAFGALLIVTCGLLAFAEWIQFVPATNILEIKEFWALAGILFYFGSSFFIFITYHYLSIVSSNNVGVLWRMHNVFLTIGCILFFKAIMCTKWIQKSS